MISSVNSAKLLNIVLPNSNKALGEVLKDLPPEELEKFSGGKDLKGILDTLLKESASKGKSNTLLLELLQKNPTLKKLGSFANGVEKLLAELDQTDKLPKSLKEFKRFLVDVKDLEQSSLKNSIKNSGVFLESKLKEIKEPKLELKKSLDELQTLTKNSSNEKLKSTVKEILLTIKDNPKELTQTQRETVAKKVELVLKELTAKPNVDSSKNQIPTIKSSVETKLSELVKLLKEPNVTTRENTLQTALKSFQSDIKTILTNKDLPKDLSLVLKDLSTLIDSAKLPNTAPKEIKTELSQVINRLEVVLKKGGGEIIQKLESLPHKELTEVVKKLSHFTNPSKLSKELVAKEIVEGDMKATLQKASNEVANLDIPNKHEISKHIDKLLLQIDYNQIVSSLTNSATLFVPFNWDGLEDGSIKIAKSDEDVTYCDIHLNLKKQGEVRVRLALHDEDQLNIYLYSKDSDFRMDLKRDRSDLMRALGEVGLNVRDFRIFDLDGDSAVQSYGDSVSGDIDMGFNLKI